MDSTGKQRTSVFNNVKGQKIFFRNWITDSKPKGVIVIVHGLNSHSAYYHSFALQLNENNYEVYALDLSGRGQSDGERYYIEDYQEIVETIDQLITIVQTAHPTTPVVLFGHSAGGVFASVYTWYHQNKLRGLICESFAFQVPAPGFALAAMKLLGRVIPHTRLVKLNNKDFSRDTAFVFKMNNDPLIDNEKQPAKTMQQLLLASEFLKRKMPEIKLPLFILHGTADRATMPDGSKYFMEHAGSADKELKLYEGHYHDLLNDKYNVIVIRDILSWLNERLGN